MPRSSALAAVSLATTLIASAWGQTTISARPGTITYIEGQASLGTQTTGQSLNNQSGSATSLQAGQTLETTAGRAEVQLTPGIFLRVGQNSAVKMVSPSLIHTVVEVQRGRAEVEVDQLFEQNDVRVMLGSGQGGSSQTQLVKPGLYEFDAEAGVVRVFEGKAEVSVGPGAEKPVTVKGSHLLALNSDSLKPKSFDKKRSNDELTAWSDLRSQYTGQENAGLAQSAGGFGSGFGNSFGGYGNGFSSFGNGFGGYDLGFGSYPGFGGGGFYSPFGFGFGSGFYGGPFGFAGLGYSGFGSGFYGGYPGYGFGGLGGYGGGYGYVGGNRPFPSLGNRGGYSGQFNNHAGTGRPGIGSGSVGSFHGAPQSAGAGVSRGRGSSSGSFGGGGGGGFHGGGGSAGGGAHAGGGGGGGSHR